MAQKRDYEAQKKEREVVVIDTDFGKIVILPMIEPAKTTSRRFKESATQGFYDGLTFHYVEPGKMIQGGDINSKDDDPTNDGAGDPGFYLEPEPGARNIRGSVGLAHPPGEMDKGNTQFYILLTDMPSLDNRYTVFGIVVEGLDVVEKISRVPADDQGRPLKKVLMKRAYLENRIV
ncbi:MAG TPA: peptidylprolyl isomerase [archaeon]|nr:peptidylprolyl isomerase [archaeon]